MATKSAVPKAAKIPLVQMSEKERYPLINKAADDFESVFLGYCKTKSGPYLVFDYIGGTKFNEDGNIYPERFRFPLTDDMTLLILRGTIAWASEICADMNELSDLAAVTWPSGIENIENIVGTLADAA